MKSENRRNFLKKTLVAGATVATAATASSFTSCSGDNQHKTNNSNISVRYPGIVKDESLKSKLLVPHNGGLKITGVFLDEISHDIPHQNWGEAE